MCAWARVRIIFYIYICAYADWGRLQTHVSFYILWAYENAKGAWESVGELIYIVKLFKDYFKNKREIHCFPMQI